MELEEFIRNIFNQHVKTQEEELSCLHKKKANQTELESLKEWISKIDNRMWIILMTALFDAIGVIVLLIITFIKYSK